MGGKDKPEEMLTCRGVTGGTPVPSRTAGASLDFNSWFDQGSVKMDPKGL